MSTPRRLSLGLVLLLVIGAAARNAPGQTGLGWIQRLPGAAPAARFGHAMALDPTTWNPILFGGFDGRNRLNDTWEWSGRGWTKRSPSASPDVRVGHALAADTLRRRTVCFAGYAGSLVSGLFNDTWEWDGYTWTMIRPAAAPSPRTCHAMAFDAVRNRTILFGGHDGKTGGTGLTDDTWEWDGTLWTQAMPPARPPARRAHCMAYDSVRRRILLFGGAGNGYVPLDDTWQWDGNAWTLVPAGLKPAARSSHAAVFDPAQARLVLFGGDGGGAGRLPDTWELVFCPPSFTDLGQGCLGSHGKTPILTGLELPSLGRTFHLGLNAAPPVSGSFLCFDISDPAVDLTPFGATGCWAHVNPGFLFLVLPVSLSGTWYPAPAFLMPYDVALLGGVLYAQALILDAKANPLGLITSNGLKVAVGF